MKLVAFFVAFTALAQNSVEWGNPAIAGESLDPWFLRKLNAGFQGQTLDRCSGRQGRCYKLSWPDSTKQPGFNEFANIMQSVDGKNYRGKRVRLRAHVKVTGSGRAQMWLRVDRTTKLMGFFDNMDSRPIRGSAEWKAFEIEGDVEPDASALFGGVMFLGSGEALVADTSLEIIGESNSSRNPRGSSATVDARISWRSRCSMAMCVTSIPQISRSIGSNFSSKRSRLLRRLRTTRT